MFEHDENGNEILTGMTDEEIAEYLEWLESEECDRFDDIAGEWPGDIEIGPVPF